MVMGKRIVRQRCVPVNHPKAAHRSLQRIWLCRSKMTTEVWVEDDDEDNIEEGLGIKGQPPLLMVRAAHPISTGCSRSFIKPSPTSWWALQIYKKSQLFWALMCGNFSERSGTWKAELKSSEEEETGVRNTKTEITQNSLVSSSHKYAQNVGNKLNSVYKFRK